MVYTSKTSISKPFWRCVICNRDERQDVDRFDGDRLDTNGIIRVAAQRGIVRSWLNITFIYQGRFWAVCSDIDCDAPLDKWKRHIKCQALKLYRATIEEGK